MPSPPGNVKDAKDVHHSLIQFTLKHYHAPPRFCQVLEALYSGLSAQVITADWATPLIPLQIGVYQGDPLSVVIFNTVTNTLVDTLQTHVDPARQLSGNNAHPLTKSSAFIMTKSMLSGPISRPATTSLTQHPVSPENYHVSTPFLTSLNLGKLLACS